MNAAVDLRRTRQWLVRDSELEAPNAHEAQCDRMHNGIIQRLRELGVLQFAVVPVRTAESHDSAQPSQFLHSRELILLPVNWPGIPTRLDSGTYHVDPGRNDDFVQFGNVRINFSTHEAVRNESSVYLTSMEVKTLEFFVANPYRVISRDELLNTVWGYDNYPCTRTVDNRILRLRQKLEVDAANPRHFITVYGSGYKFVP